MSELWVSLSSLDGVSFLDMVNLSVPIRFVDTGMNLSIFDPLTLLKLDFV